MKTFLNALLDPDVEQVRAYIAEGMDVNHHCSNNKFPLHVVIERCLQSIDPPTFIEALHSSSIAIVKLLLEAKADVNALNEEGQTALEKIKFDINLRKSHSLSVITRLLHLYPADKQPSNAQDLYKIALANDYLELAQVLTQRGFNINQGDSFNPLIFILKNSQTLDTPKLLPWLMTQKIDIHAVDPETQLTPLQYLFKHSSNFSMASYLLEQGADPLLLDGRGKTLLHLLNFTTCPPFMK